VLASLGDMLARIAPEASAVVIVHIIFKLITHAIDDSDKWRRFMFLVVPLLTVVLVLVLVLVGVAVWWLMGDGGLQVLIHDFGPATTIAPRR